MEAEGADIVCGTCGEQNPAGTQFCWSCRAYLGWQADPSPRATLPSPGPGPGPAPPSPPPAGGGDQQRDPFAAATDDAELVVPLDGTPAALTVNVANTSNVVDSYVVAALDAPPWLSVQTARTELLPSSEGTVVTELRIESPTLVPAQEVRVLVRVRNTTGHVAHRDLPVRVTVPVLDAPFEVRAEPRLLRVRDLEPGVCTVVVGNPRSNRRAQVLLAAGDPEQAVRVTWGSRELEVPPGGEARTQVRFEAPQPDPGGEASRTITISATGGSHRSETSVTLVQSASREPFELLALRLEPSVLRLGGRRSGHTTAVVDNRSGTAGVRVSLRGDDPENSLGFAFAPAVVDVPPGQQVSVRVTVTAPRTSPGQEVTRPLMVAASDGRRDTRAEGSVIQLASSRRGLARVILTVAGGLLMILGTLLPFVADSPNSGVELSAEKIAKEVDQSHPDFGIPRDLPAGGAEDVVSIGLALIILAGLAIFGLTGRTGRLTRVAAVLGAVVVVATFVGSATLADGSGPDWGALVAFVGCAAAYAGGLLGRR